MKYTVYFFLAFILNVSNTLAQSETTEEATLSSALKISGSVDVYYHASLSEEYTAFAPTAFADLPGFSLGMANVVLEQEGEKFGFKSDLVFGPRGEDAIFLSSELRPGGSSNVVNQLYVFWKATEALTFTLGDFNTFLGYEVISPTGNFNYSTSYMFSFGPFSHTGLKVDYVIGSGFSVMGSIMNPTDATEYNPTNDYAGGLQIGYEKGGLGVWLNSIFSEDFTQFDITAGYDVSETIYVGLNATTASDNFSGVAAYFQVATSESLKLGVRAESFVDKGLGLFAMDESVFNLTLSANYKIGNLTLIPEYRFDAFSTERVFSDEFSSQSLSALTLAAVCSF